MEGEWPWTSLDTSRTGDVTIAGERCGMSFCSMTAGKSALRASQRSWRSREKHMAAKSTGFRRRPSSTWRNALNFGAATNGIWWESQTSLCILSRSTRAGFGPLLRALADLRLHGRFEHVDHHVNRFQRLDTSEIETVEK